MKDPSDQGGWKIKKGGETYPSDDLLYFFFVALHLQNAFHLNEADLFPVAQANNLVKRTQQLERVLEYFPLVGGPADIGDNAGKEVKGIDILEDIGGFICDQYDIQIFQGLVDVSNFGGFDGCVLRLCWNEFRKRRQQGLNPRPRHILELSRDDNCI